MNVKLTTAQKIKIANTADVYKVMQQILLRENKIRRVQEHFWIVGLDAKSKILFIELLALGSKNRVNINPPEAFRMAIYKQATQAIFVHNHPSGNTAPSTDDVKMTDYLYKAGRFLQINVIDHFIITETNYSSFAATGLMKKIQSSGLWQLVDTTKSELTKLKEEAEKARLLKESKLEIVRKMKEENISDAIIKRVTGLSLVEIRGL